MEQPVRKFDYSFMILPEGRFAEDNTLPEGLVYQIQIFTQSRKATLDDINGLSPVFEKLNPSGKYTYSAGLFRDYASSGTSTRSRAWDSARQSSRRTGTASQSAWPMPGKWSRRSPSSVS